MPKLQLRNEIALYCPDHNIRACLGCHLLVLDVANAALGVHYRNLDAFQLLYLQVMVKRGPQLVQLIKG